MRVLLKNIQSIVSVEYDFPDKGLVQIIGDNSNGKSILMKAIGAITSLKILDNDERRALINDNSDVGSITIEYKGKFLVVKLHEDRNQCVVVLIRADGERIARTFRDGGIPELIEEFGFKCYNKNSVCLQLYETFGPMPFVNTTTTVNGEIVESITEDTTAKTFLTNFKEVTYKAAKERLNMFKTKIEELTRIKESIVVFDHVKYTESYLKMRAVYDVIKYLEPMELSRVPIPVNVKLVDLDEIYLPRLCIIPKLTIVDAEAPRLRKLSFVRIAPIAPVLENLIGNINDMIEIKSGKCPTCGKAFIA